MPLGRGAIADSAMPELSALIEPRLARLPRRLSLQWPGGRAGEHAADVCLKLAHRHALAWLARGEIGALADAYVRGDLEIEGAIGDVMAVAGALVDDPVARGSRSGWPTWLLGGWWRRLQSRWHHGKERDARQIRSHYDVCDDFYALWLDPRRVYSCAYYADDTQTLAQAQEAKLDLVCRKLQLGPGQRFLDIGAGWGGLLLWAAEHYGVNATGITLSRNQHAHVSRLIDERGLAGRVDVKLLDYRDLAADAAHVGRYDRIASVGMFEHVGHARLDAYFAQLWQLLRPGGLLLNHGISAGGVDNRQLGAGIGDFVEQHIFPGGELVHVSRAAQALARAGLELVDVENLRPHYARTLWAWSAGLERHLDAARELTTDATVRAYRLYLAGSAMSFERGWLGLYQLLATRPDGVVEGGAMRGAQSDYLFRRRHLLAAS